MPLPPQCEIFTEFAKLGLMLCITLGIIFLRHLFFFHPSKGNAAGNGQKSRTENTIFIFVFAINVCLIVQGHISTHLERHFCGAVKTIQSPCR